MSAPIRELFYLAQHVMSQVNSLLSEKQLCGITRIDKLSTMHIISLVSIRQTCKMNPMVTERCAVFCSLINFTLVVNPSSSQSSFLLGELIYMNPQKENYTGSVTRVLFLALFLYLSFCML